MGGESPFNPTKVKIPSEVSLVTKIPETDRDTEMVEVARNFESLLLDVLSFLRDGAGTDEEKEKRIGTVINIANQLIIKAHDGFRDIKEGQGEPESKARFMDLILNLGQTAITKGTEVMQKFNSADITKEKKGAKLYELMQTAQGAMESFSDMDTLRRKIQNGMKIYRIARPFIGKETKQTMDQVIDSLRTFGYLE